MHNSISQRSLVPVTLYEKNSLKMLEYGTSDFVVIDEKQEDVGRVRYVCRKPNGRTAFTITRFPDGTYSKMMMLRGGG